ncbi:hypothetical protein [Brachybacterium sp. ACRRE]|uniref:hypothetical protein n=1 Tax=Brachybacterium sp. ACRRE TaxID=2918184 RepID=UPI001EF17CAE|nr:hypothetical protein [Brachybacterium sp. ACRRE]MCG7308842.1 hypothetical protein [Brachybacterium sp. ACRRE]
MTFYGADTDALRDVADRFRDAGQRLDDIRTRLGVAIMNPVIWQGPDAEQLRTTWASEIEPRLGSLADEIGGRREVLVGHADEQDEASHQRGALETIWDAIKVGVKGYSVYKAGKSLLSGIDDMKRLAKAAHLGPEEVSKVWAELKDRGAKELAEGGFGKLAKTVAGQIPFAKDVGPLWEALGKKVDAIPTKLAEGGKIVTAIGDKLGPDGLAKLGKTSKMLGKVVPGVDIGVGIGQIAMADDGYGKVSGALSVAGGALMLAGVAFPPLAVVGGVLSGASLAMDLVDLGGELFGADPSKAVSEAVGNAAGAAGDAIGNAAKSAGNAISDAAGGLKEGLGSIF